MLARGHLQVVRRKGGEAKWSKAWSDQLTSAKKRLEAAKEYMTEMLSGPALLSMYSFCHALLFRHSRASCPHEFRRLGRTLRVDVA